MTTNRSELRPGEEQALGALLREMAAEDEPSPEVRERIRSAVAAEWRASIAPAPAATVANASGAGVRTPRRGQWPALALAAGLAVAAIALGVFQSGAPPAAQAVATLARVNGPVEASAKAGWQPVTAGHSLTVGEQLVTGPRGKAALTLPRGITLRLDANTRIALASVDRVVVERGAVYLDSGQRPVPGPGVRIDTAFGSARHLGTQYEVRLVPKAMQVSVREGRVETATATSPAMIVAQAGEQVSIGTTGDVTRTPIDRRDSRWDWVADVTLPYAIEDRRLSEFLAWVCRETGRDLDFATPEARTAAEAIILRGSVAGLSPDEALAAVMATTNLDYREDGGRLVVQARGHQAATR